MRPCRTGSICPLIGTGARGVGKCLPEVICQPNCLVGRKVPLGLDRLAGLGVGGAAQEQRNAAGLLDWFHQHLAGD